MLEFALLNNILISFCYLLFPKHNNNNNNSTKKTNSFPADFLIKCKIK